MADIAQVRITRVRAVDTQDGTGTPFQVTYWLDVLLAGGIKHSTWVTRNTDGTMLDDAAFGAWWDADVVAAQEVFGTNGLIWADAKALLPSDWPT